jgi:hypothetical protein
MIRTFALFVLVLWLVGLGALLAGLAEFERELIRARTGAHLVDTRKHLNENVYTTG